MKVEPLSPETFGKPLWCVYGYKFYPSMICCTINDKSRIPTIWGYSVYQNSGGFRTLGVHVTEWIKSVTDSPYKIEPVFFDDIDEALQQVKKQLTPSKKALERL